MLGTGQGRQEELSESVHHFAKRIRYVSNKISDDALCTKRVVRLQCGVQSARRFKGSERFNGEQRV